MVQWPQRGSTVTRASRDALADLPHGLGGGDRVLVARHQDRGTGDPADLGRAGVRQRLAGARVAVRALSHDELPDRRHRHRPPRPRLGRDRPLHELIGDRLHAGLAFPARLLAARPQARAGGVGRAQQRAEERQAPHQPRCRHREVKRDDGAERMRRHVHPRQPQRGADALHRLDEPLDRQRPLDPVGAAGARQVRAHGPVPGQRRQHGGPDVGGAAEAVDHQDGLAVAVGLDGHALDELRRHDSSAPRPQAAGTLKRPRAGPFCGSL